MIRVLRDRKGLTQTTLAKRAKVAQSYIAMVERGASIPDRTLQRIARALEVSMAELTQGRLVSRLGEDPFAPFMFDKGDHVTFHDGRSGGVIVDGRCWYTPPASAFVDVYMVRQRDGTFFNARGPELKKASEGRR